MYCKWKGIPRGASSCFRPGRSTVNMTYVALRLQELARDTYLPRYMGLIHLRKVYDSADRSLLWKV